MWVIVDSTTFAVNISPLLVADDVGLGKQLRTGLVVQELLLRHRALVLISAEEAYIFRLDC
jgi:hypothetical protein